MCQQCANLASEIKLFHKSIEANTRYLNLLYDEGDKEKRERQISIVGDVDEYQYSLSATSLVIPPQTRNQVRITAVIIQLSSAGTVTIGQRVWNLSANVYTWFGLHFLLLPDDVRKITQASAGILSMELMGESMADAAGVW